MTAKTSANGIKQRWRPERPAVCIGVAVACNSVQMIRGRVAFVPIETIARIPAVQLEHLTIPRHLRDDRRGCNRRAAAVAVRGRPWRMPPPERGVGSVFAIVRAAMLAPKTDILVYEFVGKDKSAQPPSGGEEPGALAQVALLAGG